MTTTSGAKAPAKKQNSPAKNSTSSTVKKTISNGKSKPNVAKASGAGPKKRAPLKGYTINDSSKAIHPNPSLETTDYQGTGKLKDKVAIITGGDSGIGAAAAIAFAKEGAKVAVFYYHSQEDAEGVVERIKDIGTDAICISGDIGDEKFVKQAIARVAKKWGKIDILVNNAGEQHPQQSVEDISSSQIERTFKTNIFSMFYTVKAALPYMPKGSSIVNTTSVTAYHGSGGLMDYAATKGAIVSYTRSLAINKEINSKKIRVNAVAPGPIWTPLIPASLGEEHAKKFGKDVLMKRPGQPYELAPTYVYLASSDSSYVTGQVLHVNGGMIVNG